MTVSENGVVGQATSFNLTLTGDTPYTYTQTFGNICNVTINENIATVTITPTETGTLTGTITFNEEATCNITITVSEPTPSVVTVTPSTVSENGVVGQDTSFDLTLSGGSTYTYTQTFGNICSVSINDNIATVTITPQTSGTLTGSITFNNEATCNITIDVAEPTPPTTGFEPTEVNASMPNVDTGEYVFTLLSGSYDSSIEDVEFAYSLSGSSDFTSSINIGEDIFTDDRYKLTIEADNQTGYTVSGYVNVYANITDKATSEYLRNYTATINLTVAG